MVNCKTAAIALILLVVIGLPAAANFVNAQSNHQVEADLVEVTQQAGSQVQALIVRVYSDSEAMQKIENANLAGKFEDYVTQFQKEGLTKLAQAQEALKKTDYSTASDLALKALEVFRNTYGALQETIEAAGIISDSALRNQEILEAIDREIQRVQTLKQIIPANATQDVLQTLDNAGKMLIQAKIALQNGQTDVAQTKYLEAKQAVTQSYQYLKSRAEQSNQWRLNEYCQKLLLQIQERFAYGKQNGIDFSSALAAAGYQSESQFLQTLQNKIMNTQNQGDIQTAIQECESISQMVQQMQQSLNQAISSQQQNQGQVPGGTSGIGSSGGSGDTGSGEKGAGTGGIGVGISGNSVKD